LPSGPGAPLVANVPLFGPKPMAAAALVAPPALTPATAAVTPPPGDDEGQDVVGDEGDDDEGAPPADAQSFGRGKVRNPRVMTLKMSRSIKGLRGNASAKGFTVDVVGAKAKEPAAGLRRRDQRIASAKIVNHKSGAELSVRFKDDAPPFRVQARGATLEIIVDGGKTAKASSKASKSRRSKRRSGSKH
jgi:hypothetical protein